MAFTLIHGMFGYLFGRAFTNNQFYLNIFFLFAMLPDIDGIAFLWSPALMNQYHRVLMHSLVIGAVAAVLLILVFQNRNAIWLFLAGFLGWGSHLFLDTITSAGSFVMPWFPVNMDKVVGMAGNMGDPIALVILTIFLCIFTIDLKAFRIKYYLMGPNRV